MMKQINVFFGLVLLFLVNTAHSQTAAVTFQVDMNNETVSADGVHIAGGFQGWDPATTLMSDDDLDGIYQVTIELPADSTYEFKFINGMAWDFVEDVPPTCQVEVGGNDNRFVTVGADETQVTYHVCWESCAACGMTTLRLRVDMGNEAAISPNGVHVAGNFQGWDPSGSPMSDADGDGVWESWASFDPLDITDGALLFKFINGNSWANPNENLIGEACADAFGNRMLSMTSENMVLSADGWAFEVPCFNSCESCQLSSWATFRVDMSSQASISPNGVHVAGSFQGWDPSANPLDDDDGDGIWEATYELMPGDYQFKFINGNDWGASLESVTGDCSAEGSDNRFLSVPESGTILYEACFNYCVSECSAGCTDDWACNFAPTAQYDDGSCDYASCINCSADYDFGNEDWAYAPDPENSEGFESAFLNEFYQDEFHIVVPSNASAIDPAFQLPLDYLLLVNAYATASDGTIFELDDLGLNVSCDFSNSGENVGCYFPASSQSCVTLAGVPSMEGTYWITFALEAYVTVFGVSVAQPLVLGGIPLTIAANFCTDPIACNYNPNALEDDGSCEYQSCAGCMDEAACNYNPEATISNAGDCTYPEVNYDCQGYCIDPTACNYVEDPPSGGGFGNNADYFEGFEDFNVGDYISFDPNWLTWTSGGGGSTMDAQVTNATAAAGDNSLHIYGSSPVGGPMDVMLLTNLQSGVYDVSFWMYVPSGSSAYYNIQESATPGVGWAFEATFASSGSVDFVMDGSVVASGSFPFDAWFPIGHSVDFYSQQIAVQVNSSPVGSWTFDSPFGGINFYGMGDGTTTGNYYVDNILIEDPLEVDPAFPEACTYPGCQDPSASNYDGSAGCEGECIYLTYDCASIGESAWGGELMGLYPDWQEAMHGVAWEGEWVFNVPLAILEPGSGVNYGIHHVNWTSVEGLPDWLDEADYTLGELAAESQHCIATSGTPSEPGWYEMTATGEVFISIFGQPFSIGEQSFSAWLEVAENPNPIPGCTYANAVNFVSYANDDDGSCEFAGCTDPEAGNFNPLATIDDGSCGEACDTAGDSTCQADNDGDGVITVTDLLILLGEFGATCE